VHAQQCSLRAVADGEVHPAVDNIYIYCSVADQMNAEIPQCAFLITTSNAAMQEVECARHVIGLHVIFRM
jgi:hypothetical protein